MRPLLALILISSVAHGHSFSGTGDVQVSFYTNPDTMPFHNQTTELLFETFDKLGNRLTNVDYGINITRDGYVEFHKSFNSENNVALPYTFYNGSYSIDVRVAPSTDYNGNPFPAMTVSYMATIGKSLAFAQGGVAVEKSDTAIPAVFTLIVIAGLFAALKRK